MSWHAIESVDNAIDATRSFLFPVEAVAWLKLAVITIFVGVGGGGGVSAVSNVANLPAAVPPEATEQATLTELLAGVSTTELLVGVGILAVAVVVGVALSILSETLRFVFYDALRTQTVRLREPARRRVRQAVRLFGFKLLVGIGFALPFVAGGAVLWAVGVDSIGDTGLFVGLVGGGIFVVVAGILYTLIIRGTDEFVVPLMVTTDSGVLDGWRRFWPVVRSQPAQFVVYIIVHFLLLIAIGIGQSIIGALIFGLVGTIGALFGLLVVFGLFGGLSATLASTAGAITLGALVVLTLVAALVFYLPVSIVVLTYVISYEVSVLAAADDDFQLLPESSDEAGGDSAESTPTV